MNSLKGVKRSLRFVAISTASQLSLFEKTVHSLFSFGNTLGICQPTSVFVSVSNKQLAPLKLSPKNVEVVENPEWLKIRYFSQSILAKLRCHVTRSPIKCILKLVCKEIAFLSWFETQFFCQKLFVFLRWVLNSVFWEVVTFLSFVI